MKQVTYKKILVTHDGSVLASSVLPHAVAIAEAFDGEVLLLQVTESVYQNTLYTPITPYTASYSSPQEYERVTKIEKNSAIKNLTKLKKELESSGILKVNTKVVEGNAGEEIVVFARKSKVDLIIMATHGRSGLGRVLLGSVADHVVRNAYCPVLLVHPKRR